MVLKLVAHLAMPSPANTPSLAAPALAAVLLLPAEVVSALCCLLVMVAGLLPAAGSLCAEALPERVATTSKGVRAGSSKGIPKGVCCWLLVIV